jgi:hypothetical protein
MSDFSHISLAEVPPRAYFVLLALPVFVFFSILRVRMQLSKSRSIEGRIFWYVIAAAVTAFGAATFIYVLYWIVSVAVNHVEPAAPG